MYLIEEFVLHSRTILKPGETTHQNVMCSVRRYTSNLGYHNTRATSDIGKTKWCESKLLHLFITFSVLHEAGAAVRENVDQFESIAVDNILMVQANNTPACCHHVAQSSKGQACH